MAIELTNISKTFGTNTVFRDFCCRIEYGTTTYVTGPSGCGKTTLLRIILGLETPDSGTITGVQNLRKSVVFQEDRLCENLSAMANINLVCKKKHDLTDITAVMTEVGLAPDCVKQPVRNMSGGQRRRIAVLRALMTDFDVLCLDEPLQGLDAETKEAVLRFTERQTRGKTVIMVTHGASGGNVIKLEL